MGLFDMSEKLKSVAKNAKETTNIVKEQGLTNVVKDSVAKSIEDKKADASRVQQEKDNFKAEQEKRRKIFVTTQKMGDIDLDTEHCLLKINNATANVKKNSGLKTFGKASLASMTLGASLALELALKPEDVIFEYGELREYQLLEDDIAVESGGLGMAAVGGIVGGAAGGITGAMIGKRKTKKSIETLALQIMTTNFCFPSIIITYIKKETKSKSSAYANALSKSRQTISCLGLIKEVNERKQTEQIVTNPQNGILVEENPTLNVTSPVEQIKQLKELLDIGAITQEEFDIKKKELLRL